MKTINELEQIRIDTFNEIKMRIGEKIDITRKYILVSNSESNICKKVTYKRISKYDDNFTFLH